MQDGAGIPAITLDRLLADLDRDQAGYHLAHGSVVVVDEAGMVGTRKLARLLDHADRAQAKVVLVGDHRQLPEIDAGGVFRGLAARLPAVELRDNRRQAHAWERAALDQLRDGDPAAAVGAYTDHGRVVVGDTAEAIRERLVADWWAAHTDTDLELERVRAAGIMAAARVADVDDLNARARHRLAGAGILHGPTLTAGDRDFQAGDRALLLRIDRRIGVVNGDRATVAAVDVNTGTVTGALERNGRTVTLPSRYLDEGHLSHAYAITAHKAQGATVDQAWVLGSDVAYREWGYVALSRARDTTRLYLVGTDDGRDDHTPKPAIEPLLGFTEVLGRSRAQGLAVDHGDLSADESRRQLHAGRPRSLRDRLRTLDHTLEDARHAVWDLTAERDSRRDQLDDLGRGIRRLFHRDHAMRLETDLDRLDGDIASWQDRLDTLVTERAALIDGIEQEASVVAAADTPVAISELHGSKERGIANRSSGRSLAQRHDRLDPRRDHPALELDFG